MKLKDILEKIKKNKVNIIDLNPIDEFDKNVKCEECNKEFFCQEDFAYCPYCGSKIEK